MGSCSIPYEYRDEIISAMAEVMADDPRVNPKTRALIKTFAERQKLDEKLEDIVNEEEASDDAKAATELKAEGVGDGTVPPDDEGDSEEE